ncbi:unnamed protein product [Paramecium sonneborni]|uniref:Uncharacterized protein n=1 Tax=Paramecium sonneborni TaxID=65129 RepID=A0A8S1JV60_9CILI|nr:unnamed protein product [Paramecium sonneborni]
MGATQGITQKNISLRYQKSIDVRSTNENLTNCRSVSSQDSIKLGSFYKIAVLGMNTAVGKTAFISSLINQTPMVTNLPQTIGLDVKCMLYQQQKIQFWEFDSSEGGLLDLENRINETFNCIMIIFEQFDVSLFKKRITQVQKICNENKMTGKVPIHLIGNDRLDMKISGKEKEIQKMTQTIYDGNRIFVHIVDFTQIKELNNLLQFVFKEK